ncbi:glutamate 5-kinase [Pantoea sp.]|uniref:glutamate 5-kinase n=1 Tax=Pantoea sp. TaxID=69393 RepID=UPI0031D2975A
MGIREELQADIAEAFDTDLADAVHDFTGSYTVQAGWDPVTETASETTRSYSGRGILSRYELSRIDGANILHGDLRLTALANEVTDIPSESHTITAPDLATGLPQSYRIVTLSPDPAAATYRIQLRRK